MNMERVEFTELKLKCWPENDIYFKAGVAFLHEKLNANGIRRPFSFLHLNDYTLREFLPDFPIDKGEYLVIISSPQLLPLAKFWMDNYCNAYAIFDSRTSIETLVRVLKTAPQHKKICHITKYSS